LRIIFYLKWLKNIKIDNILSVKENKI